ncbi:MAG: hypothetical protein P8Y44_07525, partial [Acidobacteriota bacterium]
KLGELRNDVRHHAFSADSSLVATTQYESDKMYIWSTESEIEKPLLVLTGNRNADPLSWPQFSRDNSRLVMTSTSEASARLWDLETPLDGAPLNLSKKDGGSGLNGSFHPGGQWLATSHENNVALWPVSWPYARSIDPQADRGFVWLSDLAFSPDSKWLASCSNNSGLHLWPLESGIGADRNIQNRCLALSFRPSDGQLVTARNRLRLGPIDTDQPVKELDMELSWPVEIVFDPTGRYVASAHSPFERTETSIDLLVWDLETGQARKLDIGRGCTVGGQLDEDACLVYSLGFSSDGHLLTGGRYGIRKWDIETGRVEWLEGPNVEIQTAIDLSANGRYLLKRTWVRQEREDRELDSRQPIGEAPEVRWVDLENGFERRLGGFSPEDLSEVVLDPTGQIYALGTREGAIWVGRASTDQPHLLIGHKDRVDRMAFSADRQWIASLSQGEIRLWPIPDLDSPPLHSLPHGELLGKLLGFTNVRAVVDPTSSTAWNLEVGPFPGWQDLPTW